MSSLLRFEEVSCVRAGRLLFERISFALEPGSALLVRGPNGAGKSSLLRLAAGLLRPASGSIVRGADLSLADDALALDRELPLRRALAFWAVADEGGERLSAAMRNLDLDRLADVPVRLLSTGQARRARLARTLASEAPLWMLDEPLNGLDEAGVRLADQMIADHRASGGAILLASHQAPKGHAWRTLDLAA